MNTTATTPSIMATLKEATQDQHTKAERHPMQAALVRGQHPASEFAGYLAQLRHVHLALEEELREAMEADERVGAVASERHFRVGSIDADLAHYGVDHRDHPMTPATRSLVAQIQSAATERPVALLGFHYVLEGSTNGGRYIAKAILGAYGLRPGGPGTKYLDPYGDDQQAVWSGFREAMDAIALDDTDRARIVAEAGAMFDGIAGIMDDLTKTS